MDLTAEDIERVIRRDDRFEYVEFPGPKAPLADDPPPVGPWAAAAGEPSGTVSVLARTALAVRLAHVASDDQSVDARVARRLEEDTIPQSLWPAAAPFASWALRRPDLFRGKRVVELGSGPGLAGLVAAQAPAAAVALTDLSPISIAMLRCSVDRRGSADPSVAVRQLRWGDEAAAAALRAELGSVDVVIGSDVFYFKQSLVNGLRTAGWLLARPGDGPEESQQETAGDEAGPVFYCGSVVRSDRMELDLGTIPGRMGWAGGCVAEVPDKFRLYRWTPPPVGYTQPGPDDE